MPIAEAGSQRWKQLAVNRRPDVLWDAIGRTSDGVAVFVEAKAHIPEAASPDARDLPGDCEHELGEGTTRCRLMADNRPLIPCSRRALR